MAGATTRSIAARTPCIQQSITPTPGSAVLALAAVLPWVSGCIYSGEPRVLDPRPAPARRELAVPAAASSLPEGHGRLLLDTTDGPMSVDLRSGNRFVAPRDQPARFPPQAYCTTPCSADLPFGRYALFLHVPGKPGVDTVMVDVGSGTTHLLRAPTRTKTPPRLDMPAVVMMGTGLLLMSLSPTILAFDANEKPGTFSDGAIAGTFAVLGVGTVLAVWGHVRGVQASRGTTEPGASTSWRTRERR